MFVAAILTGAMVAGRNPSEENLLGGSIGRFLTRSKSAGKRKAPTRSSRLRGIERTVYAIRARPDRDTDGIAGFPRNSHSLVPAAGWCQFELVGAKMSIANRSILLAFVICVLVAPGIAAGQAVNPAVVARLLAQVNQARSDAGLAPVRPNPELGAVAQSLADDLARRGVLSHEDSKGAGIDSRFLQGGYRYEIAVELVAAPHSNPEGVIADSMANPSNRVELLTPAVQDAGIGYATAPSGDVLNPTSGYWVLDMGAPIVVHY